MAEELLDLHSVAERLSVPYEVVRRNVYGGKWPHKKISERRRFMSEEDIERVLAMTHQEPQTASRSAAHRRNKSAIDLLRAI